MSKTEMKLRVKSPIQTYLILLAVLMTCASAQLARGLTLAWDTSPGATGYKLYYGTVSSNYTVTVDAGNASSRVISGLPLGVKYYFAVTAYSPSGESGFSSEISYTITNTYPT